MLDVTFPRILLDTIEQEAESPRGSRRRKPLAPALRPTQHASGSGLLHAGSVLLEVWEVEAMPDERDLRAHFEAILGRDLVGGELVLLRERVALHAWHRDSPPSSQSAFPGGVTSREIGTTGSSTKGCGKHDVLDVGGRSRTERDGKVEFLLSDFYCTSRREVVWLHEPVTVVATPQSETAVYLTTRRRLVGQSGEPSTDVAIQVFAWGSDGSPAGPVSFDWRCFVPTEQGVVIT
jgi:hypothetical protein